MLTLPFNLLPVLIFSFAFGFPLLTRAQSMADSKTLPTISLKQLSAQLEVGDVVFTQLTSLPFKKVSATTNSWTNHVGIVVDVSGDEVIVAESRVPLTKTTRLSRFVGRSKNGRVVIRRLPTALTQEQKQKVVLGVNQRKWQWYDTGFNLYSKKQFCSRYVREILFDATGISVGEVENFQTLFKNNPNADLTFWTIWYFGNIPWDRETVTPASLLQSELLHTLFDGRV